MTDHPNLTAALADVQAHLPAISKDRTAKVKTKTGSDYSYSYVDLATISAAVLPLLGAAGLAWTTLPTLDEAGRFVLRYQLRHVSGDELTGAYPLPGGGTAQELGSAITYGRRYCLCSVVGVAPDEDDDGQAASKAGKGRTRAGSAAPADPKPAPATDPWAAADPAVAAQVDGFAELAEQAQTKDDVRAIWDDAKTAGVLGVPLGAERDHVTLSAYLTSRGHRLPAETEPA